MIKIVPKSVHGGLIYWEFYRGKELVASALGTDDAKKYLEGYAPEGIELENRCFNDHQKMSKLILKILTKTS
jgi:hypothetical protein